MVWRPLHQPTSAEIRELQKEFAGKARFVVDESMGEGVAQILRDRGFNAKHAAELNLIGHSDEDVFAVAWSERRVIFTHDSDFMDDRRFPASRNPGVVVIHPGAAGHDNVRLLECLEKTLLIAGHHAQWFLRKKLEFKSAEELSIRSRGKNKNTLNRYFWPSSGVAMEWIEDS